MVCLFFFFHSFCYPGLVHSEVIVLLDDLSATLRNCLPIFSPFSLFLRPGTFGV